MPEMPDVAVYIEALEARVVGQRLTAAEIRSPFLLRTVEPALESLLGQAATEPRRLGKRIAIGFEGGHWIVLHLMIGGRLHWFPAGDKARNTRHTAALFEFDSGSLTLTEAGTQKRAALHVVADEAGLAAHTPAGLEPLETNLPTFSERLRSENHTLKRSLTDQRLFSGIGNAYSDEILHRARLSPLALSQKLSDQEVARLYRATRAALTEWTARLRALYGDKFPEKVTAFRDGMAVHGRFGQPCPDCGAPVQRIRYARNETNYCPRCQTGERVLADRALSRLLKRDFPRTLEELERPSG
jgi:formamidopyrimidine-DNA glycosylase